MKYYFQLILAAIVTNIWSLLNFPDIEHHYWFMITIVINYIVWQVTVVHGRLKIYINRTVDLINRCEMKIWCQLILHLISLVGHTQRVHIYYNNAIIRHIMSYSRPIHSTQAETCFIGTAGDSLEKRDKGRPHIAGVGKCRKGCEGWGLAVDSRYSCTITSAMRRFINGMYGRR